MARILVSGSFAYDRIMDFAGNFTEHIVPEKLHTLSVSFQVERVTEHFGGCAGNVAYNLALLGEAPSIIATAGHDFPRYEAHLKEIGIDPSSIHVKEDDMTSVAHIMTDRANNQIAAFALAAGGTAYGVMPDTKGYECAFVGAGNLADMSALAAHAKQAGIRVYVDAGQALTNLDANALKEMLDGAAGIFCNDYELGLIEQMTGWNDAALLEKSPLLVVTLGAKGARITTKEGTIEVAAAPIGKLVDPTGAGDAHRAGFIKGLISKLSLKECGQLAATVAAYAVEVQGTQSHHFTLDELKDRYQKAFGETLKV